MKKILPLILALMLLLLCLASCDSSKHEHITGDWKYNEYGHWQPIICNLNTCHIEEAPLLEHVDDNDDNICDTCSYVILNSQTTNDTPVCSRINLCYHGNKDASITIEDAGICSELMTLITKADGTQGESSKGYYGVPYTLTIYFEGNEAPFVFCLWSDSQYSTSEQRDAEGYQYFFNDDLSDLYQYLEEKYPDEFWYSNNSQSGDSNTECVHTYGEWQYDETYHWCDWSCSLDLCDIDTTGEHFDEDENDVCDKCGYFPPINSDVMGFNLQKIVFDSLENTKRTPTKDTDVIDGINSTIKMGSNAYDAIEFCFYYNGNVSEELFEDMHYSNIVQANEPTRMIVRVKYNNINIEALKTLSQVSQITSIHISTVSELGVEPEPDVPLDSNNSQSDYVTIGTVVSDEMPPYAISCKIPTVYSTDNADIPIVLNFGLIEGCYIETEQYSKIMLRAENGKNQIIAIKFINIEEILSSEYAVKSIWDENRKRIIGFDYSHTESIVLPLSLFSGTSGQIHIGLYECSSTDKETMKLGSGAYIVLSYTRNESSISISAEVVR